MATLCNFDSVHTEVATASAASSYIGNQLKIKIISYSCR